MDIDSDYDDLLHKSAAGELIEQSAWPALRQDVLARLDKIAHDAFPIPNLPPPAPPSPPSSPSTSSSSSSSSPSLAPQPSDTSKEKTARPPANEAGALPKQLDDMLTAIKRKLDEFDSHPPHTMQRLAELILAPRAQYKALAPYLHAVDRVVQVTSGTDMYPLPLPIPDMSSMRLDGEEAGRVSWTNPTTVAVGSDEALGGALLTPIPWLARGSPEGAGGGGGMSAAAQIHSEGTETIDGPNGMGSVETVSVSVNGVPSTGHARGVTQGELLRQEQRAGVVPVSQLARKHVAVTPSGRRVEPDEEEEEEEEKKEAGVGEEAGGDGETPHARGPEEIGVDDTGPQPATTSVVGEAGVEMQGIDLAAAVGRKHEPSSPGESAGAAGSKREADDDLRDVVKKVKEET